MKYSLFHIEHHPRYTPDAFHSESFYYNEKEDYFVSPMGQHMERIGMKHYKTASDYLNESVRYRAKNYEGCPLRCLYYKSKEPRRVIEEYKCKAAKRLTSEEVRVHRRRRCAETEAVFGQMKTDMGCKRFRNLGKDKVEMVEFAFFAIAFNIKKMARRIVKHAKNGGNTPENDRHCHIFRLLPSENRILGNSTEFIAACKISKFNGHNVQTKRGCRQ